ncbi:hypothetical protein TorRG33x02_281980 [Trema orientale]|uniref:Uncharacterized protein n=1 Tax=Trema orientale TaxID=63057 RepID=A0A2P5CK36_TREOI|nr:hypothetical protein TorRG33x02_281980 [Trema orientale]
MHTRPSTIDGVGVGAPLPPSPTLPLGSVTLERDHRRDASAADRFAWLGAPPIPSCRLTRDVRGSHVFHQLLLLLLLLFFYRRLCIRHTYDEVSSSVVSHY